MKLPPLCKFKRYKKHYLERGLSPAGPHQISLQTYARFGPLPFGATRFHLLHIHLLNLSDSVSKKLYFKNSNIFLYTISLSKSSIMECNESLSKNNSFFSEARFLYNNSAPEISAISSFTE